MNKMIIINDIKAILSMGLKAEISTWNRAVISDITASVDCGVKMVSIAVPVSDIHLKYILNKDRDWVLEQTKKVIDYAKELPFQVYDSLPKSFWI